VLVRTTLLVLGAGIGCGLGCGQSTPSPSDPAIAREMLKNALDAWKQGDSLEAYKQTAPAVTVVDRYWKKGTKLLDYELGNDSVPSGYDVRFSAKLTVLDAGGKASTQKPTYNVCTTPALVIVRGPD